jgi:predicted transcriptional regulator
MALKEDQIRLIFGLKLRQIREGRELSLFGLSKKSGLSKSYLNEIEKGKKYPKPDKIVALANALDTTYDEMVSMKLTGTMAPLSDIIMSGILKEIPLNLFGIEESHLIDIIANAPEKVTAFIGTLFEIARSKDVTQESFYLSALRSYQEAHQNYFPEIENAVASFVKRYQINVNDKLSSSELEELLIEEFGYTIDYESLKPGPHLGQIRSIYDPKEKRLLIAKEVSETQRVFILAKELGYCHLGVDERPLTFSWIKFEGFEQVLNNFKASYFAGSLILNEKRLVGGLKPILQSETWNPDAFFDLMFEFTDSAETFFQRITNLLPRHFGIQDLFFLRFAIDTGENELRMTKEFHMGRSDQPRGIESSEKYCRRWASSDILLNEAAHPTRDGIHLAMQRSHIHDTRTKHLILAASNEDPFNPKSRRSLCIGINLNQRQKKRIGFSEDPNIPDKVVGNTCERCAVEDCESRVAKPVILNRIRKNEEIEKRVEELIKSV